MKFTLRQARKIESKIKVYVGALVISDSVRLRTNDNVMDMYSVMEAAQKQFLQEAELKSVLIKVQHDIRTMIGTANEVSGINKLLTDNARLVEEIKYITYLSGKRTKENTAEFKDAVQQKQQALVKGEGRYSSPEVTFNAAFLEPKVVEGYKERALELTRQLEKNQDAISQLNFTYQITLVDEQFKPLQRCKLL